jgi:uncharacterized SAM-binding protein YcdF (DUF218 family)
VASTLIAEDHTFSADHVLLLGGDGGFDRAAEHCHAQPKGRILLVDGQPSRLVSYGLLPANLTIQKRELLARGAPPRAIEVLPGLSRTSWEVARQVKDWLGERPEVRVVVLCRRFDSRRQRYIFRRTLGDDAERIGFVPLADREYDETNWWQHKRGMLDLLNSSLGLGYTRVMGEDEEAPPLWSPDDYERSLQ